MTTVDLGGAAVVVTGGTRGLGRAIGLEFGRAGAMVFVTHRWGSADEDELRAEYEHAGARAPHIVESDASDPAAMSSLMMRVGESGARLAVIVSNVAFAKVVDDVRELRRSPLELSLRYSAWPIVELLHAARETLGQYPRYALGISSDGGAVCHPGYDMVGVSKAVLETLCRYLALHLRGAGVRVNAVRSGLLDTENVRATFGEDVIEAARPARDRLLMRPAAVARACVALCSGLMDSVTGQVITVDEGASLIGPVPYLTGEGWPAPFPEEP